MDSYLYIACGCMMAVNWNSLPVSSNMAQFLELVPSCNILNTRLVTCLLEMANTADDKMLDIPISALRYRTQNLLAKYLDGVAPRTLSSGLTSDFRGLADQCGFDVHDIRRFQRFEKPTEVVLREWHQADKGATVRQLFAFLEQLERFDVIDELRPLAAADAENFRAAATTAAPDRDAASTTLTPGGGGDELGKPIFVCVADGDIGFLRDQLLARVEDKWGMRVYLEQRDMLGGAQWSAETAEVLAHRCSKVLVVLSPRFLASDACSWVLNYAQAQSVFDRRRRLIPLVIHPVDRDQFPAVLQGLSTVDLTRGNGDAQLQKWAWEKLKASLAS